MKYLILSFIIIAFFACKDSSGPESPKDKLAINYVYIGDTELSSSTTTENLPIDEAIDIRFNKPVDIASAEESISLWDENNQEVIVTYSYFNSNQLIKLNHNELNQNHTYQLIISDGLIGAEQEEFEEVTYTFTTLTSPLVLETILVNGSEVNPSSRIMDVDRTTTMELHFDSPVSVDDINDYSTFKSNGSSVGYTLTQSSENVISFEVNNELEGYTKYSFNILSTLENRIDRPFEGLNLDFYTAIDPTYKFPEITDEELLTKVQEQTFKYFWDFAHPTSGLIRERNTSNDNVTIGGSGFGVMSILVGIERGFITRSEGVERLGKVVNFLSTADRWHGVWPHWMNGVTGETNPFSSNDDGGDIVETAFMIQGLLAVRRYLNSSDAVEKSIIDKITTLWEEVEWDWYTQGENSITWHWSPNYGFEKNMKVRGWNEALIVYVLAASSPTHTITKNVYDEGWARNGNMINGNSYYNVTLPLGNAYGGPLFFEHYSFLCLDPRNLSDQYASYWEQAKAHTLINRGYCIDNPGKYVGYNEECWGLTASDNHEGYSAHSPTNDLGVITPTAALSSFPYTPDESMAALKHFYYILGDKLWGEYGFYDAFNITEQWTASSFLAIDQGPIIVMLENHRTALLWDLFMQDTEVQAGLNKLGFSY
ncbi:glucoamylase family protein [Carboxylicivirga linearis]|uniref:Ig-like domain-containing protein n=1 Tax=Carboxylicivirga linearis TaxID=1628157 RepID=A0ABS5JRR7_9BACT|nr:glucoamylase family protein [Carboxylicivirga linearis]MBS2097564.1 Ig-like domain-containing protein [Carboxylicivirga linearis]